MSLGREYCCSYMGVGREQKYYSNHDRVVGLPVHFSDDGAYGICSAFFA